MFAIFSPTCIGTASRRSSFPAANAADFFSGTDLARWIPSRPDAWRVEKGEILGHGNVDRAEFLTSDLVAENYRLTAQLELTGPDASAEIAFRGQQTDGGFQGCAFRLATAAPPSLVRYDLPAKPQIVPSANLPALCFRRLDFL